mmetsp:Transcript_30292/g.51013  ORF Transcript_30292/g.51013 Transcript_30292/m.51013 type:complete len:203 (+) Transcript_30292:206-814(+)
MQHSRVHQLGHEPHAIDQDAYQQGAHRQAHRASGPPLPNAQRRPPARNERPHHRESAPLQHRLCGEDPIQRDHRDNVDGKRQRQHLHPGGALHLARHRDLARDRAIPTRRHDEPVRRARRPHGQNRGRWGARHSLQQPDRGKKHRPGQPHRHLHLSAGPTRRRGCSLRQPRLLASRCGREGEAIADLLVHAHYQRWRTNRRS